MSGYLLSDHDSHRSGWIVFYELLSNLYVSCSVDSYTIVFRHNRRFNYRPLCGHSLCPVTAAPSYFHAARCVWRELNLDLKKTDVQSRFESTNFQTVTTIRSNCLNVQEPSYDIIITYRHIIQLHTLKYVCIKHIYLKSSYDGPIY